MIGQGEMSTASLTAWVCGLVGLSCGVSAPDVAAIQSAYEREAASGSKLHDLGLQVLAAKCDGGAKGQFLCEVTFMSKTDPDQRLYFDVISVAVSDERWELRSGLCKR
jgi:hypothetical protein